MTRSPGLADQVLDAAFFQVAQQRDKVASVARAIEGKFGALGDAVGELIGHDAEITNKAKELETFVRNKDALVHAYQLFKKSSDLVQANLEHTGQIAEQLRQVEQQLACSGDFERDLADAVRLFWILRTSIRIETAAVAERQTPEILRLVAGMDRIHRELKTLVDVHFHRLHAVRTLVTGICVQIGQMRTANRDRVKQARERVQQILDSLQATLDRVSSYRGNTKQHNDNIRECFEHIIVALQYQDIVRQKLDHVMRAFERMLESPAGETPEQHWGLVHFLSTVQGRQIGDASQEICHAKQQALRNVTDLLLASELTLSSTKELQTVIVEALSSSRAADTFVQKLSELHSAIALTSAIAQNVSKVVEEVRAEVVEQVAAMGECTTELRSIALNAQFQAARMSTGAALKTLAAQTRANSEEMRAITGKLMGEVRNTVPELERIDAALRDLRQLSSREETSLNEEALQAQVNLRQLAASVTASLGCFESDVSALKRKIETLVGQTDLGDDVRIPLEHARACCLKLSASTAQYAERGRSDPWVHEALRQLRSNYVMEVQRNVHDVATRHGLTGDGASAEKSTSGSIERFEAEEPGCRPAADAGADLGPIGDNVELF